MVLDEKIVGVELSSQKKTFKWPVQEEQAKKNNNNNKKNAKDDDDDESTDDFSALQKTLHVHSVGFFSFQSISISIGFLLVFRLFSALEPKPINEILFIWQSKTPIQRKQFSTSRSFLCRWTKMIR